MPETDDLSTTEINEADEDHLLEDDGDSFWMIQRFVWGTIKTILLIGGIGLVLWLVWGNGSFKLPTFNVNLPTFEKSETKKTEKNETSKSKKLNIFRPKSDETTPKIVHHPSSKPLRIKNPAKLKDLSWSASKWNIWLQSQTQSDKAMGEIPQGNRRTSSFSGQTTTESVKWLRDAEKFFAVKPLNWITGANPRSRESELNRMIRTIDYLLERSAQLKSKLQIEIAQERMIASSEQSQINTAENQILKEIDQLHGQQLESFMRQKITAENQKFSAETESWLRSSLLQKIKKYEPPLQNIKQNAQTNRQAIIHNIKVVNFPNDPFQRIEAK
jgi:hypothetical protein